MSSDYKKLNLGDRQIDEHRYMMEQHLGRKLDTDELVHHINENKRDNRIENFEVMWRPEHTRHHFLGKPGHPCSEQTKAAVSLAHQGEHHPAAKLTDALVAEIKRRRESGESFGQIAKALNIHRTTASRACSGALWKHLIPSESVERYERQGARKV